MLFLLMLNEVLVSLGVVLVFVFGVVVYVLELELDRIMKFVLVFNNVVEVFGLIEFIVLLDLLISVV